MIVLLLPVIVKLIPINPVKLYNLRQIKLAK